MMPLLSALLLLSSTIAPQDEAAPSRPNILFLLADDQRADTIGAWGNEHIDTPTLDGLAARGFSFRQAHCMGSPHGAVCQPSRAMLNTGHAYHGLDLNDFGGAPTLGQLLGDAGYRTFATGKWHNGREAFKRSFQSGRAVFFGGMSDHTAVPIVDLQGGELVDPRIAARRSSERFADAAIEFLSGLEGDEPFLAYVAFTAPHDPRDPPPAFRERYYADRPPLPGNFLPFHPFDNGWIIVRDENLAPWPRTEAVISDQLCEYYGHITHLDGEIARILAALARSGRAENTIVVTTADHGLAMGSHGLLGKQSLYEHSMGAPLIVAGPGIPKGSSEALVYLHDLFPTLLGLAGVDVPEGVQSLDLAPIWRGERERVRETLFTSFDDCQRAVRDDRWKLIRYPEVDVTQLFDLVEDPLEMHNLADDPAQVDRIAALRAELERWQAELGDTVPWTAETVHPAAIDPSGTERKPDPWQPRWIVEKYFR
jgi:arylsulfatase A-like enzyme